MRKKIFSLLLPTLLSASLSGRAALSDDQSTVGNPCPPKSQCQPEPNLSEGAKYRVRYPLKNAAQKRVDNHGNGDAHLYGVRNFRAVLNGVYYRGGANNYYNRNHRRNNQNPLPNSALENLCEEGFGHAVYLYPTNFGTAPRTVRCRTFDNVENRLDYLQITPLRYQKNDLRKLHGLIFEHIRNPRLGPVYMHCWNGWHASGYVAATTLRQFCGFSAKQAVQYWNLNTDGNAGREYDKIRQNIVKFEPSRDFVLTAEERAELCPAPPTLQFQAQPQR